MGGSTYTRTVGRTSTAGSSTTHNGRRQAYTDTAQNVVSSRGSDNKEVVMENGRIVTCNHKSVVMVIIDGTGSMGEDLYVLWDKMPMLYGQIVEYQKYLEDVGVVLGVVGDAYCDKAPVQLAECAQGDQIDDWLKRFWLERGGGGQHKETYELMAWGIDNRLVLEGVEQAFLFFVGDEGYYPEIDPHHLTELFGRGAGSASLESYDSLEVFKNLQRKFHLFRIHKRYGDGWQDKAIRKQWQATVPEGHFLTLEDPETGEEDPKAIVDVILGAIALTARKRTLSQYGQDMLGRGQTVARIRTVKHSLQGVEAALVLVSQATGQLIRSSTARKRGGKTKRL